MIDDEKFVFKVSPLQESEVYGWYFVKIGRTIVFLDFNYIFVSTIVHGTRTADFNKLFISFIKLWAGEKTKPSNVYSFKCINIISNYRQFALIYNTTRIYMVVGLMVSVSLKQYFYPLDFYG